MIPDGFLLFMEQCFKDNFKGREVVKGKEEEILLQLIFKEGELL